MGSGEEKRAGNGKTGKRRRKIEGSEERERNRRGVGRSVQKEDRERRKVGGTATQNK